MILRTILLLAATAMAALLAGCGGSPQEGSSHQDGSGSHEVSSPQQREATNTSSVGSCADNGSTVRQQQAHRGEVSNGKIAFSRSTFSRISESASANTDIHLIDGEGAHETQLTYTKQFEAVPVWSPYGGKIAFNTVGEGNLYLMNADGTDQTKLAEYVTPEEKPAWAPDGGKIAFTRGQGAPSVLYVINADGTNEAHLTTSFSGDSGGRTQVGSPVWSPDGEKIAFASLTLTDTGASSSAEPASAPAEGLTGIYLINVDGTGLCKLTSISEEHILQGGGPVWSPDGEKIAFYDNLTINVINADGSGRKQLTGNTNAPPTHAWSPDGQRIALIDSASQLSVINADGSGLRRLTNSPGPSSVAWPTWSPDSEKIAFSCPFEAQVGGHTDLCVINADGTGWKRIATKVAPVGSQVPASWGRG
jgi:Tol biopolymer transport system component